MTPIQLVRILQITDSFFPVGAFAYSDGLETAASSGRIRDADGLKVWLDHFLDNVFIPCDGLAVLQCAHAMQVPDHDTIRRIDDELTAIRPSAAVRSSSRSIGKRLLASYAGICPDHRFSGFAETLPHGNAPVAYALVLTHRGIAPPDAVLAFGYSRLAGIVSAGLRLISLGQQQAQTVLSELLERLPGAVERIMQMESEPLRSFMPFLDIEQMNHRHVYSRMFRS